MAHTKEQARIDIEKWAVSRNWAYEVLKNLAMHINKDTFPENLSLYDLGRAIARSILNSEYYNSMQSKFDDFALGVKSAVIENIGPICTYETLIQIATETNSGNYPQDITPKEFGLAIGFVLQYISTDISPYIFLREIKLGYNSYARHYDGQK